MAPAVPVVDLFADAPAGDPKAAAYLLAAYAARFPHGTVFLAVVDPGVGGRRPPVIVEADGRWFVGAGNGLFELVQRRARPMRCSKSPGDRHPVGELPRRDLFAPVAATIARGDDPPGRSIDERLMRRPEWPADLAEIVYLDHYGNAMAGLRASVLPQGTKLAASGRIPESALTFSDQPPGEAFWYANSNGIIEIAANLCRAGRDLGLAVGTPVEIVAP
jgi:hypothetical protein